MNFGHVNHEPNREKRRKNELRETFLSLIFLKFACVIALSDLISLEQNIIVIVCMTIKRKIKSALVC